MRISTILKMTAALMIGALTVTSCANDVETDINIDPSGDAISFSPSVGHASRATEVDISILGNFAVIAKGVHQSGDLYSHYIIGSESNNTVVPDIAYGPASPSESNNIWSLNHSVYWPSDMNKILFWAYTTDITGDQTDDVLSSGTVTFGTNGPKISDFVPETAVLSTNPGTGIWGDGYSQKDLLIAFQEQAKNAGTAVALNFKHALTQINIQAKQSKAEDSQDHRVVKIRGAWIYNVRTKGDLSAGFDWNPTSKTATHVPVWQDLSEIDCYGSYYSTATTLTSDAQGLLGKNGSLMIIPQSTTDTYILLLCRIELEHDGATHEGGPADITDIDVKGNKHYHQLFPVADKYDAKQYGFTCVHLSTPTAWEMGKKYMYTLDICGVTAGAGVYPPKSGTDKYDSLVPGSDTNIEIVQRKVKNDGDPVLDEPIKFNVTVGDWTEAWTNGSTNGNVNLP